MADTQPSDFLALQPWFDQFGKPVFPSAKLVYYHIGPIQKELIEAGALARVGNRIYLHKTRFWPEYQRIVSANLEG